MATQFRFFQAKLRNIYRNPSCPPAVFRLVPPPICRRISARLILEIDVGKLLAVVIAHDIAGVQFLDRQGRREAAEGMARRSWYYRVAVKLIFVIFGILGASAAQAQNAPWCLQTSSLGGYQSCTYATFEQCLVDRAAKNGFCTQNSTYRLASHSAALARHYPILFGLTPDGRRFRVFDLHPMR